MNSSLLGVIFKECSDIRGRDSGRIEPFHGGAIDAAFESGEGKLIYLRVQISRLCLELQSESNGSRESGSADRKKPRMLLIGNRIARLCDSVDFVKKNRKGIRLGGSRNSPTAKVCSRISIHYINADLLSFRKCSMNFLQENFVGVGELGKKRDFSVGYNRVVAACDRAEIQDYRRLEKGTFDSSFPVQRPEQPLFLVKSNFQLSPGLCFLPQLRLPSSFCIPCRIECSCSGSYGDRHHRPVGHHAKEVDEHIRAFHGLRSKRCRRRSRSSWREVLA